MGDDDTVTGLVIRAQNGDQAAWDALVERYSPLVWSICRRYGLDRADAEDVGQTVWSRLVNQLGNLRDPAALPGWLATTTQRECCQALRTVRSSRITTWLPDAENIPDSQSRTAEEDLLTAERHAALREAFTSLSPFCQELMALLIQDPPVPYAQISAKLDIPVGSIGPARRRCLEKLRRHPAIVALMNDDDDDGPAACCARKAGLSFPQDCRMGGSDMRGAVPRPVPSTAPRWPRRTPADRRQISLVPSRSTAVSRATALPAAVTASAGR